MYATTGLPSDSTTGLGIQIDKARRRATFARGDSVRRVLASLRARRTLVTLPYVEAPGLVPLLIAYATGDEPELGIFLAPTSGRIVDDSVTTHLCGVIARLALERGASEVVLVEAALALRAAYGDMPHPGPLRRSGGGLAAWQDERVRTYIDDQLEHPITTADVAALCNLSSSQFTRAFRETHGLPPRQWIIRRRVQRAQSLLAVAGLSLCDIALACGFGEQTHFTRSFTRLMGQSPGAWRRRLLLADG